MLEVAKAFLESNSASIIDIREVKKSNQVFYTIDAKVSDGKVQTFQLRGSNLYQFIFNYRERLLVSEELIFQFTERQ